MVNIDYYIEKAKNMPNISDGGSEAYGFGDVVLVKYRNLCEYGNPRKCEEEIAKVVNEKNAIGVRTPKHLSVKRTTDGKYNYCWVLQECAKGNNYSYYSNFSKDVELALERLKIILNAPSIHFEKLISDIGQLFNMGLELKPKNLFYDEDSLNGGFTIIDLLESDKTPYNSDSISDVYKLSRLVSSIYNALGISPFSTTATSEQKAISETMINKLAQRIFQAMELVVPNFEQHRRWLLRTYDIDKLNFFMKNGLDVGNLTLNDEEINLFTERVQGIVFNCLNDLSQGKYKYWQIGANNIRLALKGSTLNAAWLYHKDNQMNLEDFENYYDYEYECRIELERLVNEEFDRQLEQVVIDTDNSYLLQAKEELDKKKTRRY